MELENSTLDSACKGLSGVRGPIRGAPLLLPTKEGGLFPGPILFTLVTFIIVCLALLPPRQNHDEAIRPSLGGFMKEVMLCIRYYGETFRGHPPGRIILTGSEAREPHLEEALADHCKIPVVFEDDGLPLGSLVEQIHSQHLRNPGPTGSWAVAAGLSLRGLPGRARAGKGSASARRKDAA